ncbi:MAG: cyclic nucleotide-binding domain-containing protein [Verrucomicrobiota bacterium]|nr:cyclic nucleotide-binding domain-containing protein [Verrucomicrobiota bacterium]
MNKLSDTTFNPEKFCPRKVSHTEIYDRGAESENRYILRIKNTPKYTILDEKEYRLWDLIDNKRNIHDIIVFYMKNHGGFAVDIICAFLRRLWLGGFIENEPKFAEIGVSEAETYKKFFFKTTHFKIPLGIFKNLASVCSKVIPHFATHYIFWMLLFVIAIGGCYLSGGVIQKSKTFYFALKDTGHIHFSPIFVILLFINFIFSFFKKTFSAGLLTKLGKEEISGGIIFYYGLPLWYSDDNTFPLLNTRKRMAVALSTIIPELFVGALFGAICNLLPMKSPLIHFSLFAVMLLLYIRVFFAVCPVLRDSFPQKLLNFSSDKLFFVRSLRFFHHNFVNIIFGDEPLQKKQVLYVLSGALTLFWSIMAAKMSLSMLDVGQQFVRDLLFSISAGSGIISTVFLGLFCLPFIFTVLVSLIFLFSIIGNGIVYYNILSKTKNIVLAVLFVATFLGIIAYMTGDSKVIIFYLLSLIILLFIICSVVYGIIKTGYSQPGIFFSTALFFLIPNLVFFAIKIISNGRLVSGARIAFPIILFVSILPFVIWTTSRQFKKDRFFIDANNPFFLSHITLLVSTIYYLFINSLYLFSEQTRLAFEANSSPFVVGNYIVMTLFLIGFITLRLVEKKIPIAVESFSDLSRKKNIIETDKYIIFQLKKIFNDFYGITIVENDSLEKTKKISDLFHTAKKILGKSNAESVVFNMLSNLKWEDLIKFDSKYLKKTPWENVSSLQKKLSKEQRQEKIKECLLFKGLDEKDCEILAENMKLEKYAVGELIVKQNDPANAFYIICSGQCQVEVQSKTMEIKIPAFLSKNNFFGEMGLLENQKRQANVRAISETKILSLDKRNFMNLAETHTDLYSAIKLKINDLQFIREIHLFDDLSSDLADYILPKFKHRKFDEGDNIIKQGDPGTLFYVIKNGTVVVIKEKKEKEIQLCELHQGEYFGEIALVQNVPRTATVRAVTETETLCLDKANLLAMIGKSDYFSINVKKTTSKRELFLFL